MADTPKLCSFSGCTELADANRAMCQLHLARASEYQREYRKRRQQEDPAWAERERAKQREYAARKRREDPAWAERERAKQREYAARKRQEDPAWRARVNAKHTARKRAAYKTNPTYKARRLMREMLKRSLAAAKATKSDRTSVLLGYSPAELRAHLESLFAPEMTWENHGTFWHVDHVVPMACWPENTPPSVVHALANLRPLSAAENLSRGAQLFPPLGA